MSKTELKSRSGGAVPGADAAVEVKAALTGFVQDFKTFQAEIEARLKEQEQRMQKLDRKSVVGARPALAAAAREDAPHKKALAAYLRSGDDDGLRGIELEGKALNAGVAAEGGFLVDPQTADRIKGVLQNAASVRSIANVVQVEASAFDSFAT